MTKFYTFLLALSIIAVSCKKNDITSSDPTEEPVSNYDIHVTGAEQVPPNTSLAHATFKFKYDPIYSSISYVISYTGIIPREIIIQKGATGVSGGVTDTVRVLKTITGPPATSVYASGKSGSFQVTKSEVADLRAGLMYLNITSIVFPNGEIRAQVLPESEGQTQPQDVVVFDSDISGVNTVPAFQEPATASGAIYAVYYRSTKTLFYTITYGGITVNAMHFHKGAAGVNGDIQFSIASPYTSGKQGSVTLSAAQEADLLAGLWYFDLHSTNAAASGIRAQVTQY